MRLYKAIVAGVLTSTTATGAVVALPTFTATATGATSGPGVTANLWHWRLPARPHRRGSVGSAFLCRRPLPPHDSFRCGPRVFRHPRLPPMHVLPEPGSNA